MARSKVKHKKQVARLHGRIADYEASTGKFSHKGNKAMTKPGSMKK